MSPERANDRVGLLTGFIKVLWLAVVAFLFAKLLGWVARRASSRVNAARQSAASQPQPRIAHPLHRDPWCGTYVADEIAKPLNHSGQVLHFCSDECRTRYLASGRRPSASHTGRASASA